MQALKHRLARWWVWVRARRLTVADGTRLSFTGDPAPKTIIIEVGS